MSDFNSLSLFEQLLPLLIPPVVAFLLKVFTHLPKWVVPSLIGPGLGIAGQLIAAAMSSVEMDPVRGLILGALAIFVREISSKLTKAGKAMKAGNHVPRMDDNVRNSRPWINPPGAR